MAKAGSLFDAPGVCVALVGAGLVVGLLGLGLALDYRGVTTRHVTATFRVMRPVETQLRRVPPWRLLRPRSPEVRHRSQLRLERFIGGWFAGLGVLMLGTGVVGLIGWMVT